MRILVTPQRSHGSRYCVPKELLVGLRQAYDVCTPGEDQKSFVPHSKGHLTIWEQCREVAPIDLLVVSPSDTLTLDDERLDQIRSPKALFVNYDYQEPVNPRALSRFIERFDINLIFTNYPQLLDTYRGTGIESRIFFLPPCFPPESFRNWGEEQQFDLGLFFHPRSAHSPLQRAVAEALQQRGDLRVFDGGALSEEDAAGASSEILSRAINRCRIAVTDVGEERYPQIRLFQILGSHSALFTGRPHVAEMLHLSERFNFVEITPESVAEKLNHYLSESKRLTQIAEEGYQIAQQFHTARARAEDFMQAYLLAAKEQNFVNDTPTKQASEVRSMTIQGENRLRLNLGCGGDYREGYINIDSDTGVRTDLTMDLRDLARHFTSGSIAEILMLHSIAYLTLAEAREFFVVARKLLATGGELIIETPNIDRAIEKIRSSGGNFFEYLEGVRAFHAFGVDQFERGEQYTPYRFSWSATHLLAELREAGFAEVELRAPETHAAWRDMRVVATRGEIGKSVSSQPVPAPDELIDELIDELPRSVTTVDALILVDTRYLSASSARRKEDLINRLRSSGATIEELDISQMSFEEIRPRAADAKSIYLVQVNSAELVQRIKRELGVQVIFEMSEPLWKPAHRVAGWIELEQVLAAVDLVSCENEQLARYAGQYAARVVTDPLESASPR